MTSACKIQAQFCQRIWDGGCSLAPPPGSVDLFFSNLMTPDGFKISIRPMEWSYYAYAACSVLSPHVQKNTSYRKAVPVLVSVCCTLYKLAHGTSLV